MRLCMNLVSSGAVANFAGEQFRSLMWLRVNFNPQFIQSIHFHLSLIISGSANNNKIHAKTSLDVVMIQYCTTKVFYRDCI